MILSKEDVRLLEKDGLKDFVRNKLSPIKNLVFMLSLYVADKDQIAKKIIQQGAWVAVNNQKRMKSAAKRYGENTVFENIVRLDSFLNEMNQFVLDPDSYESKEEQNYEAIILELIESCPKHV